MPMFRDRLDEEEELPPGAEVEATVQPILLQLPTRASVLSRKLSEESIRTELCDGPIPDSPNPRSPELDAFLHATSDRADLIQRLKRGESPTWIPNRHLESLLRRNGSLSPSSSPRPRSSGSPTLPAASAVTKDRLEEQSEELDDTERMREGMNIERPRSALHSGDFTQIESSRDDEATKDRRNQEVEADGYRPIRHTWLATSPPRDFSSFDYERRIPFPDTMGSYGSGLSSLSSSLSSSFVYKHPTSPLVQSESNDELDFSLPMTNFNIAVADSPSPGYPRRQTLGSYTSFPSVPTPAMRREGNHPYQAHQPRRSLTSPWNSESASSPQTPAFLRSRRPSYSSESSPMQHASMVGSYEESILRGRMSTNPSKPLGFMAQIGVLGLGKCKSSLRCPSHVTLPFSAVFYSYASTPHGRSKSDDGPSPYVGQIDLENGLPNTEEASRAKRKIQNRNEDKRPDEHDVEMTGIMGEMPGMDARKPTKPKRRSASPKAPPGGSYRIPEKGQIQIIIKNQNKTAVKLFLVPYDLAGMEPGTKTFIRQRSYSAGSIIENVAVTTDPIADKVILRYLIHMHICCPARGRYYLYKSIRVVFANRVPDGKEKLRNEFTFPEPRFTPYKPVRVMHPPMTQVAGPAANLAAEKAFRRRSSGFSFGQHVPMFDRNEPMPSLNLLSSQKSSSQSLAGNNIPVEVVPIAFTKVYRTSDVGEGSGGIGASQLWSTDSSHGSASGGASLLGDGSDIAKYDKLRKGDFGYGGIAFAAGTRVSGAAESLLSQRLRSLGMQGQQPADNQRRTRFDGSRETGD